GQGVGSPVGSGPRAPGDLSLSGRALPRGPSGAPDLQEDHRAGRPEPPHRRQPPRARRAREGGRTGAGGSSNPSGSGGSAGGGGDRGSLGPGRPGAIRRGAGPVAVLPDQGA